MTITDADLTLVEKFLEIVPKLNDEQKSKVIMGVQSKMASAPTRLTDSPILQQNKFESNKVQDKFPNIVIPTYVLLLNIEYIFTEFLKEIFKNYDEDYRTGCDEDISNDNSIMIVSFNNETLEKKGQYPRIAVQCLGGGASQSSLANVDASNTIDNDKRSAMMQFSVRIVCMAQNYNEANLLSGIAFVCILENHDLLRNVFGFSQIGFPQIQSAQMLKNYDKVYGSVITFTCTRMIYWANITRLKTFRKIILRLLGQVKGDVTSPIIQIANMLDLPLNDQVRDYLDGVIKGFEG